ncbi:hypothetical protein [Streptosporangium sandarakinum]
MSTSYKDQPAWQQAQEEYLDEAPGLTPSERLVRRILASQRMYELEQPAQMRRSA